MAAGKEVVEWEKSEKKDVRKAKRDEKLGGKAANRDQWERMTRLSAKVVLQYKN